jgi:predicted alpha/beta-hydrolase family hydrolase
LGLDFRNVMNIEISVEQFADTSVTPEVRGFLHRPKNANGNGLVLTHGAGANCQSELLTGAAEAFAGAGFMVLRVNLPFRQLRSYGPPGRGDAEKDRAALKNAAAVMRKLGAQQIFLGGHSYGGRQATMLCAEDPEVADGLLLLSYPLHPPRKPEQLRTQHLPSLRTPVLFVQGTRDPFGSITEMESAIALIPGKTRLLAIDGAGHDLKQKGKSETNQLPATVLLAFQQFTTK